MVKGKLQKDLQPRISVALRSPRAPTKRRSSLPDEAFTGFWKHQRRVAIGYLKLGKVEGFVWKICDWNEVGVVLHDVS